MRTFLVLVALIAVVLVAAAVAIEVASVDPAVAQQLDKARSLVWAIGGNGWSFARPLLQLIVVFLILDWLLSRIGVRIRLADLGTWNTQTFIAGLIITTFCVAVLANIEAVSYLKDVVLIVIGFYFGTRARRSHPEGTTGIAVTAPTTPPPPPVRGAGESREEPLEKRNPVP